MTGWLWLVILAASFVFGLVPVDSSFKVVDLQIFGLSLRLAHLTLDFPDDLYLLKSTIDCQYEIDPSCPSELTPITSPKFPSSPTLDCITAGPQPEETVPFVHHPKSCTFSPCDYTSTNKTKCVSDCACEDRFSACELSTQFLVDRYFVSLNSSSAGNWIKLEEGENYQFNSIVHSFHYFYGSPSVFFRFYLPNSCFPVSVSVIPSEGDPEMRITRLHPLWGTKKKKKAGKCDLRTEKWMSNKKGGDDILLCPSDPYFSPGTYFIEVEDSSFNWRENQEQPVVFNVSWKRLNNRKYLYSSRKGISQTLIQQQQQNLTKPFELLSNGSRSVLVLKESQMVELVYPEPPEPFLAGFRFDFPESTSCPMMFGLSFILAFPYKFGMFFSLSESNPFPNTTHHDFMAVFAGSKVLSFSLCRNPKDSNIQMRPGKSLDVFEDEDGAVPVISSPSPSSTPRAFIPPKSVFFTVDIDKKPDEPFRIWTSATSDPDQFYIVPFSSLSSIDLELLIGLTYVDCQNRKFVDSSHPSKYKNYIQLFRAPVVYSTSHPVWPLHPFWREERRKTSLPIPIYRLENRTITGELMLQYTSELQKVVYIFPKEIPNCKMVFGRGIVDREYYPVVNQNHPPFVQVKLERCNYATFHSIKENYTRLINELRNEGNVYNINRYVVRLQELTYHEQYSSCMETARSYLVGTKHNMNVTRGCTVSTDDPSFKANACCDPNQQWFNPCVPVILQSDYMTFTATNNTISPCGRQRCSEIYLQSLAYRESARVLSQAQGCRVEKDFLKLLFGVNTKFFRRCVLRFTGNFSARVMMKRGDFLADDAHHVWDGHPCFDDSDCVRVIENWNGKQTLNFHCNRLHKICEIRAEDLDDLFLNCFITDAPMFVIMGIKNSLNTSVSHLSKEFSDLMKEKFTLPTCTAAFGWCPEFNRFTYDGDKFTGCFYYKGGEGSSGLDCDHFASPAPDFFTSVPEDCQNAYFEYISKKAVRQMCIQRRMPNWSLSPMQTKLRQTLLELKNQSFCALCDGRLAEYGCQWFDDNTPDDCESGGVCILNSVRLPFKNQTIGEKICSKLAECTRPCYSSKPSCRSVTRHSNGICLIPNIQSAQQCRDLEGYREQIGDPEDQSFHCYLPHFNHSICKKMNATWAFCTGNSMNCSASDPSGASYLSCGWTTIRPCANQTECEASGGICSNTEYFLSLDLRSGACVGPRAPFDTTLCRIKYPGSKDQESRALPNGCIVPLWNSSTKCREMNSSLSSLRWVNFPSSERECLSEKACLEIVTHIPYYKGSEIFTQKSEANCLHDGWISVHHWKKGKWISGKFIRNKWITADFIPNFFDWKPRLDINQLYIETYKSVMKYYQYQAVSNVECSMNPTLSLLDSILCDCKTNSTSARPQNTQCYQNSLISVSIQQLCDGSRFKIYAQNALFDIYPDSISIPGFCVKMLIYNANADVYRTSPTRKSFGTFTRKTLSRPPAYGDSFSNAVLVGDGTIIVIDSAKQDSTSLGSLHLCLYVRNELNEEALLRSYPIRDLIAIRPDKNTGQRIWIPLELDIRVTSLGGRQMYCAKLTNSQFQKLKYFQDSEVTSIFPAVRRQEWQSSTELSTSEKALMISLSVMYFLGFVYCSVLLYFSVANGISVSFFFLHCFRISITLMLLMRFLYFLMVAVEVFNPMQFNAAEQILSQLPQLLLFTAFSAMSSLFIVLSRYDIVTSEIRFRSRVLFLAVNFLVYVAFVLLILLLVFLPAGTNSSDTCGGLLESDNGDYSNQSLVTTIFNILLFLVSFMLFMVIIVTGLSIYWKLKALGNTVSSPHSSPERVKIRTIVLVCGFSFFCMTLLLLFYTVIPEMENVGIYGTIFLIFFELIPSCVVLWMKADDRVQVVEAWKHSFQRLG